MRLAPSPSKFSVMFCPICRAEYRPGFTFCSDCDVELVADLSVPRLPSGSLELVYSTDIQSSCVSSCQRLQEAGIPYTVNQERHQSLEHRVDEHYQIAVPAEFASRAKAELGTTDINFRDEHDYTEEELGPFIGFPEDGTDATPPEPHDDNAWYHEDATVEIYSEPARPAADRKAWMMESSLHENGIRTRTNNLDDGSSKIFVMPQDESRAREIVREILDASRST